MRRMNNFASLVTAIFLASPLLAGAHTAGPSKHGGTVAEASELAFELISVPEGATLYVEDHGKPLSTAGMMGKLTVLTGNQKSEADLRPAGDNRLEAKGIRIDKGSKSVASLSVPGRKPITVRFSHR